MYVNTDDEREYQAKKMETLMTAGTCERCGAKGYPRITEWTCGMYCDECFKKVEPNWGLMCTVITIVSIIGGLLVSIPIW